MAFEYSATEFEKCPNCRQGIWPGQRVVVEATDSQPVHKTCPEVKP